MLADGQQRRHCRFELEDESGAALHFAVLDGPVLDEQKLQLSIVIVGFDAAKDDEPAIRTWQHDVKSLAVHHSLQLFVDGL